MPIFRVHKENNYTTIDNNIFKNTELSWKATGLIATMLSLPDDWNFSINGLATLKKDKETIIRNALKELEDLGYLKRTMIKDSKGRIVDWEYDIYECPVVEKPHVEKPLVENQPQLNTNIINNLNNKKKEIYKERFIKPTLSEVEEYCKERNNNVDAKRFFDYYEVNNWKDSKGTPVKNWKQKMIANWESKAKSEETEQPLPKWFNQEFKEREWTEDEKRDLQSLIEGSPR